MTWMNLPAFSYSILVRRFCLEAWTSVPLWCRYPSAMEKIALWPNHFCDVLRWCPDDFAGLVAGRMSAHLGLFLVFTRPIDHCP